MSHFAYRDGMLHAEEVPLPQIAAAHGTPCYVYSRAALLSRFEEFRQALCGRDALVCYAVKANSNLAILNLFARTGAGFDIVSGGELARVIAAGGDPAKVVFSGVGKTKEEMRQALAAGIFCFNVESPAELERLNAIAGQAGKRASIALRVNPDVDPKTHPYISTGLRSNKLASPIPTRWHCTSCPRTAACRHRRHCLPHRLATARSAPAAEAAGKILALADQLAAEGIILRHLDLGGGLGIRYRDETPLSVAGYLAPVLAKLAGRKEKILFEPGRALVGNAGLLLTRIEHLKHGEEKNFAIVDAAMNDLMRPALYDAWHDILPVRQGAGATTEYEIVGPVCESGDFLGHARALAVAEGDLLSVMSAGAYGMAMSSNYNTRPRAAEVIVDGSQVHLVRERERLEQLFTGEHVLP